MQGFKEFVLKGNLVELAVAFIMGTAFAAVVTEFAAVLMGFVGKAGGQPDFADATLAEVNVGLFINALIAFLVIAAVIYFFVVTPYNKALEHFKSQDEEEVVKTDDVLLLEEIRDLLARRPQV
ncbi:MscL family protein [Nocardioides donggukensis]|uniref:MscL family protein n=1 Tax=Nocardioides donggukensis TaxID=2774019 RepID=A0A927K546_9ACTN|nr:MscL family protein [Nocardioides donggukensis]MBD8870699.1 MscL family protein [Nocardioides donggukensis]